MRVIHPETLSLTTSSGSASGNTSSQLQGLLRQVLASPTTSTTTYDIKLTNNQSLVIYERIGEIGDLAEEVVLPVRGVYTLALANATKDEAFTVSLVVDP